MLDDNRTWSDRDNLLDGLLALGLADLGLHVALGHDVSHGGTDDGTGVFHCASGAFLLSLLLETLLVLASVQDGPLDLTWITLHKERALALLVDEGECLKARNP